MLTPKLFPNRTLTHTLTYTLILTPKMKKQMKKAQMNISHFCCILFNLKIFGEIVTSLPLFNCKTGQARLVQIELNCNIRQTHALTTTPLWLCIECVKVLYLSQINNEKKAIYSNDWCSNFFWYWKPNRCTRHFLKHK